MIEQLKKELPDYQALAEGVSQAIDPIAWWKDYEHRLPHWSQACKYLTLIQPSSAAAERVFSLLHGELIRVKARECTGDYIEASVMLQYNQLVHFQAIFEKYRKELWDMFESIGERKYRLKKKELFIWP